MKPVHFSFRALRVGALLVVSSLVYATNAGSAPLVQSSAAGTVLFARSMPQGQQGVILQEDGRRFRAYLGLDRILVKRGDRVRIGMDLGTGASVSIRQYRIGPSKRLEMVPDVADSRTRSRSHE